MLSCQRDKHMAQPLFSVFRVICVLGLVAIAIWLFMGGHHSATSAYDGTPSWLFETPSWILGTVSLALAVLAAVLSAETIEDIVARLLGESSDE